MPLSVRIYGRLARHDRGLLLTVGDHGFEMRLTSDVAEKITGQVGSETLVIHRGVLPGGTSQFDPQPTASFDVVAKLTGAANSSSGYDVSLVSTTSGVDTTLATVGFRGSDGTSALLKFQPVSWPSVDRPLTKLVITAVGAVPGVLDVNKAYLKIRQAGTVKRHVGVVPMGTRQAQVTSEAWSDIADPFIYRHVSGDFSPAPTVTLRATGQQYVCGTFFVRMFNITAASVVSGSELSWGKTMASKETPALSLSNGHDYKLQARISLASCAVPTSGTPEPTVPTGDLVSAELTFAQTTTDSLGLTKTVGWFPQAIAAEDFTSEVSLGFRMRVPGIELPNPLVPSFESIVYRRGTSGAAGARLVAVEGNFDAALEAVRQLGAAGEAVVVNSVNPDRLEGQQTVAWEICDALDGAPDAVALPVGNAGNITAAWRGFTTYAEAGRTNGRRPRMLGFQAAGAAPIVAGAPVAEPVSI